VLDVALRGRLSHGVCLALEIAAGVAAYVAALRLGRVGAFHDALEALSRLTLRDRFCRAARNARRGGGVPQMRARRRRAADRIRGIAIAAEPGPPVRRAGDDERMRVRRSFLGSVVRRFRGRRLQRRLRALASTRGDPIEYWNVRAKLYGEKSVVNLAHREDEIDALTSRQVREVEPHLRRHLDGSERTALDFGCGTGRFAEFLASLVSDRVIAVDPAEPLLRIARRLPRVDYRPMKPGCIPAEDGSIDVVWIGVVLGGIRDADLPATAREIERVASARAVFCVVENTDVHRSHPYWSYRPAEAYRRLFEGADLRHVHDFRDEGERISVLIGRRRPADTLSA
jgi:ubiquinone/menaquinone biosynthesis C-methylase UbiE